MPSVSTVKWTNHRENRLNTNYDRVLRKRKIRSTYITPNLSSRGVHRDINKHRNDSARIVEDKWQSLNTKELLKIKKEKRQSVKTFTLQFKKRSDDFSCDESCKVQSIKKEKWQSVDIKLKHEPPTKKRDEETKRRSRKLSKRWRLKGVLIPLMILNVTGQVNGAVEGKRNYNTNTIK